MCQRSTTCPSSARHALAEPWCPERCGGACLPQLGPLVARKKSPAVLTGPHSVPLASAQFHPPPGSRQGLYQGSWKEPVAQHCPCPGPTWGAQTHPRAARLPHAVCPCLLSATLALGPHHAASSTPPTPRSLETCPFCLSILPLLLFIVMVSRLGRRRAPDPSLSVCACLRAPGYLCPGPRGLSGPFPAFLSTAPPDWRFWGRILFVSLPKEKTAFSFVQGWLCFGGLLFSWFCLVFISPGISSLYLVTSPLFSPALSSSTDATRWQF